MEQIVLYLIKLIQVYMICIFAWVLLSWIPVPYNSFFNAVRKFLDDVVGPYMRLFRGVIPPLNIGGGQMDLSPIVGILALHVLTIVLGSFVG